LPANPRSPTGRRLSALVECALDTWGRIDGIVHNAAILRDEHVENVDDTDYDAMMNATCAAPSAPLRPSIGR
jgi:NAD(P)-dependent dehydrogenase (short-subunit alcohol dehydrogenase family)